MRFANKIAFVSGAASGIGKAIVQRFAVEGAYAIVADINAEEAERVASHLRTKRCLAEGVKLDVASEADWESLTARVLSKHGAMDVCVNCAGIAFSKPLVELSLSEWRRVMSTNLDGVFLGTREAMRAMQSRGGVIVNVASAAGLKPIGDNAVYGTSKAAVRFLTRVAAIEGAAHKIRVVSVSPGAVATPMWKDVEHWPKQVAEKEGMEAALEALVAQQGFARAEEIASAVAFLASDEARTITGADLTIDGGFSALETV